jgi:hypothetical protein
MDEVFHTAVTEGTPPGAEVAARNVRGHEASARELGRAPEVAHDVPLVVELVLVGTGPAGREPGRQDKAAQEPTTTVQVCASADPRPEAVAAKLMPCWRSKEPHNHTTLVATAAGLVASGGGGLLPALHR